MAIDNAEDSSVCLIKGDRKFLIAVIILDNSTGYVGFCEILCSTKSKDSDAEHGWHRRT